MQEESAQHQKRTSWDSNSLRSSQTLLVRSALSSALFAHGSRQAWISAYARRSPLLIAPSVEAVLSRGITWCALKCQQLTVNCNTLLCVSAQTHAHQQARLGHTS